jgi:hypothetical protein
MNALEPPHLQAAIHRVGRKAGTPELSSGDDTMLAGSEHADPSFHVGFAF